MTCAHHWVATPTLPVCVHCGRTPNASPSQVETWRDCQRKWAYSRVRPRGFNRWAAYGERCHGIAEAWLRDCVPPDANTPEGRTVLAGLHLLPMPRTPGLLIEHRATPTLLGVNWDMRLDYIFGHVPGVVVIIGDHKTTGDIAELAKSEETLSTTDPQGIAYSHWAAEDYEVAMVVGQWTYYQRDAKAAARPVVFSISRNEARDRFEHMHETEVLPMVRSRVLQPEELPRSLEACSKYGGCDYQNECLASISPIERAGAALVQLRRKEPTHVTTAPILPAAGAPDLLAGILAAQPPANTAPTAAPAPTQQATFNAWFAELTPEMQAQVRASMGQGTAPAATVAPVVPAVVEAPQVTAAAPVVVTTTAAPTIVIPESKPAASPETPAPAPARGRGRPPKSETFELLKACAMGGLKASEAREYIALAGEAA